MSKYVKNLVSDHIRRKLEGVTDALLVNVIGLGSGPSSKLRAELRSKNINLLVVKNSMASRAVSGTPLASMFEDVTGSTAICWGSSDIVSLAKEITKLLKDANYKEMQARGGVMEGSRLSPEQVAEVAKWPSREEQIAILVGQILGPGARLASQLCGPGGALASQIKQKGEGEEAAEGTPPAEGAPAAEGTAS
jgi:large subunit ribosomal protein L10